MLTLKCDIEIRSKSTKKIVRFSYANSIEVKTSRLNLTDTATVKVPRKMNWRGKPLTEFVRRDDEITIRAGYAEHGLETLFHGYVKDVENGTPVVISCENEMRLLKGITVEPEVIQNFDIRAFVKRYAQLYIRTVISPVPPFIPGNASSSILLKSIIISSNKFRW